jgi:N-acetylglucosaminyl-diphospho-decaprenol L-rhamnosyltransferase
MATQPIIDAVIVSYNSRATLRGCVEPLTRIDDVHVVVVDNASPEDPLDTISDLDASIVRAPRNGGFSYGCNLGAEQGSAPYVLFINPDARIDEASLAALRGVLEADPSVGVAGPRILDADGTLLRSQRRFPRPGSTFGQALFLHRVFPNAAFADELIHDDAAYERAGTVDWLSGACLLVRRSALADIGGMDEGFFLYCEDTDLSRRMLDAGYSTRFEPSAEARHEEGSSAPRSALLAIHARSRVRYARRHFTAAAAALDTAAIALHAATHAVANFRRRPVARGHAHALRAVITGPVT